MRNIRFSELQHACMHAQLNIPTKKTFLFRVNDAGMSAVPVGQAVSPDA